MECGDLVSHKLLEKPTINNPIDPACSRVGEDFQGEENDLPCHVFCIFQGMQIMLGGIAARVVHRGWNTPVQGTAIIEILITICLPPSGTRQSRHLLRLTGLHSPRTGHRNILWPSWHSSSHVLWED